MHAKFKAPTLALLTYQTLIEQTTAQGQGWTNLFDFYGDAQPLTFVESSFTGISNHLTTFAMFMNTNTKCGPYVHGFQLNGAGVTVPTETITGDVLQTLTLTYPQQITEIEVSIFTYRGYYCLDNVYTQTCPSQ